MPDDQISDQSTSYGGTAGCTGFVRVRLVKADTGEEVATVATGEEPDAN